MITKDPRKSYQMNLIKINYCVVHKMHWITDCPECIHMDYLQDPRVAARADMYEALKNCIIDAGQPLTKGERLRRIKYAKAALAKGEGK
ncbi:hypothetical protein LCGC14_0902530 [marine sediment metagenome]|uniref:Uncharacterized protein n=1 Tax=marine sediment metagenome TaxID=412755 RepID=A0A0F9P0V7_9ZZZZ